MLRSSPLFLIAVPAVTLSGLVVINPSGRNLGNRVASDTFGNESPDLDRERNTSLF